MKKSESDPRMEKPMQYNLSTRTKPISRTRGLVNLLHMGHCAPAAMQTVLDINHTEQEWLVKLMAGMPGGIGNTGFECGAITSPLVILGLRYGWTEMRDGLPLILDQGHAYYQLFLDKNAASFCKDIQIPGRLPVGCIHAVSYSAELLAETLASDNRQAIPAEQREAYSHLYIHLRQNDFHCAHAVFQQLSHTLPVSQELLNATSAFVGGTLFKGITCSAFTAGVMAIGLKIGEIENSYPRVMRMLVLMVSDGDPFNNDVNKFNRAMNTGQRLSEWFRSKFGSTQCHAITQCNFACEAGVEKYIAGDSIARCRRIAEMTAKQVQTILEKPE
jgi:C_GCAxxG_C_C family probable redox protein